MTKKKIIKIIIACVVLAVVAAGVVIGLKFFLNRGSNETVTYTATVETYENVIEISGTVSAAEEQTLQALSAGTVLGVYVKAGDKVKKGDVILQLDDTTEQYNLEKQDYDIATKRITGSPKEIKLMETQRLALVQKIADRKVVATFDGVIADLDVAVGDSLEAKDSVGTIVNIDYLTAEVEVAETDVSKLVIGQKVELEFPAYSGEKIYGYITGWPAIGEITSRGATIVKAKIRIDEYPEEILPNFSFTGKIEIEAPVDNIIVSRNAIGFENRQPFVVLAKTGEKVEVKVVPYGKEYMKVTEGLNGGEVLLQQSRPKSGQNKDQKNGNKAPSGGMPSGSGNGSGKSGNGGGMGGMPGGMPPF